MLSLTNQVKVLASILHMREIGNTELGRLGDDVAWMYTSVSHFQMPHVKHCLPLVLIDISFTTGASYTTAVGIVV